MKYIINKMKINSSTQKSPLAFYSGREKFFLNKKEIIDCFNFFYDLLLLPSTSITKREKELKKQIKVLEKQILNTYCLVCKRKGNCSDCKKTATLITNAFIQNLPNIQELIFSDIDSAYKGDPAAKDYYEIFLCYPSIFAVGLQRLAHFLYIKGVALIPRLITEYAHSLTGIDIHPGAKIGREFFIDHGTGVVIGETAIIGDRVKIYQGVTLGAKSFPLDKNGNPQKNIKRHPCVENDVTIYAEATILGNIVIGEGSVIAGNTWVTESIPPYSICKEMSPQKNEVKKRTLKAK